MTQAPPKDEVYLKQFDIQIARRLMKYARPYTGQFLISLVLMVVGALAIVAGPYFVKMALDTGIEAGDPAGLRRAVVLYLITAAVQWTSIFLRVNIMARAGQGIIYDLRNELFEHLQHLSLGFYSRYSVGRVITRVVNDVSVLRDFLTWTILATVRDVFVLAGIVVAMLAMNVRLSLLAFSVLPVMWLVTVVFRRYAIENYRQVRAAISWVNSVLAENINGVRVVQAFARQEVNYAYYRDEVNYNNLDKNLKAARVAASFPAAIEVLGGLAMALVVWRGGAAALGEDLSGTITAGVLVAFVLYINRFFDPIRDLSRRYDQIQSAMAGGERVFKLLDTPVEVEDAPDAGELPPVRGEVDFVNVSFHYSDDPSLVLENINLHVPGGQTVALVGKTGAGKTTLIKLLSRFHDPTVGQVCIDGYNLRTVTQNSLRRQMGIVLQDPFLFAGSVADNIRFGRIEASDAEVEAAARAVGAHEFITRLPQGYDSQVEEGGVVLSVGQRQLISFARALLADPRLLILDEATSSVDTQTELVIQEALEHLLEGRTAFVIAHRLSTIVNADRIVVIEGGEIVEEGTHAELLALQGVYYDLYTTGFEEMEDIR